MPLESGSFINDLTPSNPPASDPAGQGDDHLRLIKACVQGTMPNMGAIFGQVRRQDTALSISSTWNTNHFICSASATATVVLTLPPAGSITTGFYVDITTIGTGTVSLLPSGAASINGGVSLSIPRLNTARAYFVTGTGWLADTVPHAQGGTSVITNLAVDGTLSVSGATALAALTVNGVATLSAAVHMKSTLSVSGATTLAGLTVGGALTVSAATVLAALTVAGTATLSGTVILSNGQLKFPAAQNASTDVNVLDDYEEGTWTPTITFVVPGNLAVTYTIRTGSYVKVGGIVHTTMRISTATFTHTTASGNFNLTGYPFTNVGDVGSGSIGYLAGTSGVGTNVLAGALMNASTIVTLASYNVDTGAVILYTAPAFPTGVNKEILINTTYPAT